MAKRRLNTGAKIRVEMAATYEKMKSGELDLNRGYKLIAALEAMGRALERETVEKLAKRLDAAEGQ